MGGAFLVSEQRPGQQMQIEALTLRQGEGLIFANPFRPVEGDQGAYRAAVKHGVSRVRSGVRFTLGIFFHDAQSLRANSMLRLPINCPSWLGEPHHE
jgi:hypothetical protein